MLNKKILECVVDEVKLHTINGLCVVPKRQSPIVAVDNATTVWLPNHVAIPLNKILPTELSNAQSKNVNPEHTEIQHELTKELTERITASVLYIKGHIVDEINECKEVVDKLNSSFDEVDDINIIRCNVPESIYSSSFPVDLNRKYMVSSIPNTFIGLTEYVSDEHVEYKNWIHSIKRHHEYYNAIFNATSEVKFMQLYNKLDQYDRIDLGIVMCLGAISLLDNPDRVSSLDLSQLNRSLRIIRDRGCSIIQRSIRIIETNIRSNKLVHKCDGTNIYVNSTVYDEYLRKGGTADAMVGRCVADDGVSGMKTILNNVIQYTKIYNKYNAANDAIYRRNIIKTTKHNLYNFIRNKYMNKNNDGVNYNHGCKKALDYIKKINTHDVDNVYELCKCIIAKYVYCHTNAYKYLCYMDEAYKHNDKLSAEECSFAATLELLCDFGAGNLKLVEY